MTRSLVSTTVLAAMAIVFATPDVEARCCRARHHRHRCCNASAGWGTSASYQYGSSYQSGGACCQPGTMATTQYSTATSTSTPWVSNYPANQGEYNQGYGAPTNIETRPKTAETAPAAGPAPAGATTPEEAPRPGT